MLDSILAGASSRPLRSATKLLPAPKMQLHHIFPQSLKDDFEALGIQIHNFCVELSETVHLRGVHGNGLREVDPRLTGQWNEKWKAWLRDNPNADATAAYQQAGMMMDEFGLSGLPIVPYR